MRSLCLLALACAAATAGSAQPLAWEHVGDRPFNAQPPSFAADGSLLTTRSSGSVYYKLSAPYGPAQTWVAAGSSTINAFDDVFALGQDTLIVQTNVGIQRSVDNGVTFTVVSGTISSLTGVSSIPHGLPYGGSLVGSSGSQTSFGVYSRDRGATWHTAPIAVPFGEGDVMDALVVVRRGPRAGRIVTAGGWGIAMSDDGGASYSPVPGFWEYFRYTSHAVGVVEGAAPGGGDRLLVLMNYPGHVPDIEVLVAASDDGGDSWYELSELTGDPNYAGEAVVDFGGGRVAAVMNGGHVWQSGDGGASWLRTGQVPGAIADPEATGINGRVSWALRGTDGRLYVGGTRLGNANPGWAFRTAEPLSFAVAGEAGPSEAQGLGVTVRPNPARSRVEVVLSLAEAGVVRAVVVDALGREVAVVLDGPVSAGERVVGVDTASWPTGVYVVQATAAGVGGAGAQTATARLVVAR